MTMTNPTADHPHTDPGDGRTECDRCGKFVFPAIHSCKGVPVTAAARDRWTYAMPSTAPARLPYTDADVELVRSASRNAPCPACGRTTACRCRLTDDQAGYRWRAVLDALAAAGRLASTGPNTLPGPHILAVQGSDWTIEHPAACTVPAPTGPVIICLVEDLAREQLHDDKVPPPGRYEIEANDIGDRLCIFDRVDGQAPAGGGCRCSTGDQAEG
jgi:hypothetical protein